MSRNALITTKQEDCPQDPSRKGLFPPQHRALQRPRLTDCGSLITFIIPACRKRTLSGPASTRGTEEGERKRRRRPPPRPRMNPRNDLSIFPTILIYPTPCSSLWNIDLIYLISSLISRATWVFQPRPGALTMGTVAMQKMSPQRKCTLQHA